MDARVCIVVCGREKILSKELQKSRVTLQTTSRSTSRLDDRLDDHKKNKKKVTKKKRSQVLYYNTTRGIRAIWFGINKRHNHRDLF